MQIKELTNRKWDRVNQIQNYPKLSLRICKVKEKSHTFSSFIKWLIKCRNQIKDQFLQKVYNANQFKSMLEYLKHNKACLT